MAYSVGESVGVDGEDDTVERPVAVLLRFILRGVLKKEIEKERKRDGEGERGIEDYKEIYSVWLSIRIEERDYIREVCMIRGNRGESTTGGIAIDIIKVR